MKSEESYEDLGYSRNECHVDVLRVCSLSKCWNVIDHNVFQSLMVFAVSGLTTLSNRSTEGYAKI